ncbi:MAG TPA: N-acetyltransferase, partial [Chloroflexia bacterium]|nr:N-acetyltransferase [Chloroflexia bacterium]
MKARPAAPEDAASMSRIYNQGIEDRIATFETRQRTPEEVMSWLADRHPVVAVEDEGRVIAFAATSTY